MNNLQGKSTSEFIQSNTNGLSNIKESVDKPIGLLEIQCCQSDENQITPSV